VDPGPDDPAHVEAVLRAAAARGGVGAIAVTHDHADHAGAVGALRERCAGPPVGAARLAGALRLAEGDAFGPLRVLATPGHAPDHLAFLAGPLAFTGDAVLGAGSVFVTPVPGALAAHLASLERLRDVGPELLLPGHGPVVRDPLARLDEMLAHRRAREAALVAALQDGLRGADELLDRVWAGTPGALRLAAAATLAAHLDKLAEEGRLPEGVERPRLPPGLDGAGG